MKPKFLLVLILIYVSTIINAQSWQTGTNKIYSNPASTTNVGIGTSSPETRLHVDNGALKIGYGIDVTSRNLCKLQFGDEDLVEIGEWEADDVLTLKAPNGIHLVTDEQVSVTGDLYVNGFIGIGNSSPEYPLDVNGKAYLRTVNAIDGWNYSYLYWPYHSLVMGTPPGSYAHNSIDLMPGGSASQADTLFSRLRMFSTSAIGHHRQKMEINTENDVWFLNEGNFGIGTATPHYKLDVNGTIHAKKVIVSVNSGADYVFDKNYSLPSLKEVGNYIQENKHLPDIQSESEMISNGVNLQELTIKLLQKVEELTLYTIEQEKRIAEQEMRIKQLEQK